MNLANLLNALLDGWDERIEYAVITRLCSAACNAHKASLTIQQLRHHECDCPTTKKKRSESRRQPPLLLQLVEAQYAVPVLGGGGGGASVNKPQSKVPGNLVQPDEVLHEIADVVIDHCGRWRLVLNAPKRSRNVRMECGLKAIRTQWTNRTEDEIYDIEYDLGRSVVRARVLLGYESTHTHFADTVCGICGGRLTVARELPVEVRCVGTAAEPPCGNAYPWHTWVEMLVDAQRPLVGTEEACLHTGVPRGTLYRWASEGTISRYGGRGKGKALWDLDELSGLIRDAT